MEQPTPAPPMYDLVLAERDYPEWFGPPRRTLVVCTQPRCGSTLLGEALFFAGGLGNPLEYFHVGFQPVFERYWGATNLAQYIDLLHRRRTDPSGVFSLKLFWSDVLRFAGALAPDQFGRVKFGAPLDEDAYRRLFAMISPIVPNPVFVFLTRRDQVRQAISSYVATITGEWRRFSKRSRSAERPVYDFDKIARALAIYQNERARWEKWFQANRIEPYRVAYEDLARDYEGTVRGLLTFLGRSDAPIHPPRLRKQADDQSEELVERFMAEFRARANGT